jgi:hypothetical protein
MVMYLILGAVICSISKTINEELNKQHGWWIGFMTGLILIVLNKVMIK